MNICLSFAQMLAISVGSGLVGWACGHLFGYVWGYRKGELHALGWETDGTHREPSRLALAALQTAISDERRKIADLEAQLAKRRATP